jgi:hypothetical protein
MVVLIVRALKKDLITASSPDPDSYMPSPWGISAVSTSTFFARSVAIVPHLTAFALLTTGIADAVVVAVVKMVGAEFVDHFPAAGVVYSAVPDAIIAL